MTQIGKYPDTMHRVCVKAVIRNNKNKVLCLKENTIFWDLPGGGVGHGETLDQALTRELLEEISYQGKFESMIIDNVIAYHKPSERCYLFIVYDVTLESPERIRPGVNVQTCEYLDPIQFKESNAQIEQLIYRASVDSNFEVPFHPTN